MTGRALALDLASRYGFAAETPQGVDHGSLRIGREGMDMGERLHRFEVHFTRFLVPRYRPTEVLIEAPWVSGDDSATHFLLGLVGVARMLCARHGLPTRTIAVPDLREKLTGIRGGTKEMCERVVRGCGFTPVDDNAADALALLLLRRGWHKRLQQPGAEIVRLAG